MKRITMMVLMMLLILGTSLNGTASPPPTRCHILVYVPFTFHVATRAFPAGYYRFEQITGNSDGVEVLVVRSLEHPEFYQAVATKAENLDETQPSKIVFRRSGERLVLAEVCSHSKHAVMYLYEPETKQAIMMARAENDDVEVTVPSDGELLVLETTPHRVR